MTTSKQLANAAPTLPVHSPHSPVHPSSYPNIQKNKLSGRYINNKRESENKTLINKQWTGDNKNTSSEREIFPTSPLEITCNCVKSPNYDKTIIHKEGKCFDFRHNPSKNILPKERIFNMSKSMHSSTQNAKEINIENLLPISRGSFEKTSSEANLKKTVRKSPVYHKFPYDKANINPTENLQGRSYLSAQDNQNKRPHTFTVSKSEQTSPNNLDPKITTFRFEKNNRNTGSLLYVSSMDPWTKKKNVQRTGQVEGNPTDPWVKRSSESYMPADKTENPQVNPFSSTRTPILSDTKRDTNYLLPELYSYKNGRNEESVFSAPPSPHFLNMSNDCSINRSPKKALHTKSASFSPARGKHLQNPFDDVCDVNTTKVYFPNDYHKTPDKPEHIEQVNYNLLHVNNSKILQNRHSFSSIAQQSKEELQLNIRRLSEQMGQISLKKIVQLSLSDCNVNKKVKPSLEQQQTTETIDSLDPNETDNRDHQETLKSKGTANSLQQHNSKVSAVFGKKTKVYASYQKRNPMQETTC